MIKRARLPMNAVATPFWWATGNPCEARKEVGVRGRRGIASRERLGLVTGTCAITAVKEAPGNPCMAEGRTGWGASWWGEGGHGVSRQVSRERQFLSNIGEPPRHRPGRANQTVQEVSMQSSRC